MFQDIRYGLRLLFSSKVLTITAILSLAFGIGANTSLFSLAEALLFRTLPVENPRELVLFNWAMGPRRVAINTSGSSRTDRNTGENIGNMFSYLTYQRFREHNLQSPLLADIFGFVRLGQLNVSIEHQSHVALGQLVSGTYYSALRVPASKGRLITEADDHASAESVAVLSYRYWEQQLGMDPNIVGKTTFLNTLPLTIIGVTSPEFIGVEPTSESSDISIPLAMEPRIRTSRSRLNEPWSWWLMVMGRMKPGIDTEQIHAHLNPVFQQTALEGWNTAAPEQRNSRLDADQPRSPARLIVASAATGFDNMSNTLLPIMMLSIATTLILLIVCANLANLLLAKSSGRQREVAVRLSMGARPGRLLRQLLTESIILSSLGGAAGLVVAYWTNRVLEGWIGDGLTPVVLELNLWVLAGTLIVSLFTGILFGLAPAIRSTRVDLIQTMKETGRTVSGGNSRLSKVLLVTQVAMSLVLLFGAGLFIKTLHNLQTADAGFEKENLLWFSVNPLLNRYSETQIVDVYDRMLKAIEAVPGVKTATMSQVRLLSRSTWSGSIFLEGTQIDAASRIGVNVLHVSPNFIDAMGIRLLLGRNLSSYDTKTSPKVALINETMARRHFQGVNPIGRRFRGSSEKSPYVEIVGVVSDNKYARIQNDVPPIVFTHYVQESIGGMDFGVRTAADPLSLVQQITDAVRQVDKDVPLFDIKTQEQELREAMDVERGFATACGTLGLLALVLASIGLYGIMSYGVTRRTNEIGIRLALGASGGNVVRMVMRESLMLVGLGVVIGLTVSLGAARLLTSLFYGLTPHDPTAIVVAVALMLGVAGFASYLPARRASRVDPMSALRYE